MVGAGVEESLPGPETNAEEAPYSKEVEPNALKLRQEASLEAIYAHPRFLDHLLSKAVYSTVYDFFDEEKEKFTCSIKKEGRLCTAEIAQKNNVYPIFSLSLSLSLSGCLSLCLSLTLTHICTCRNCTKLVAAFVGQKNVVCARMRGIERVNALRQPEALWSGCAMALKDKETEAFQNVALPPRLGWGGLKIGPATPSVHF